MKECVKCGWYASDDSWWSEEGLCYSCEYSVCNYIGCPKQRETAQNFYCTEHSIKLYMERANSTSGSFTPYRGYPTKNG